VVMMVAVVVVVVVAVPSLQDRRFGRSGMCRKQLTPVVRRASMLVTHDGWNGDDIVAQFVDPSAIQQVRYQSGPKSQWLCSVRSSYRYQWASCGLQLAVMRPIYGLERWRIQQGFATLLEL